MRHDAITNKTAADEVPLLPELGTTGRYQVSATLDLRNATTRTDDLPRALAALSDFELLNRGDKDAHGAVYDMVALKQVRWVWCKPVSPKPDPMAAIFEKMIASGAPVSVISGAHRVDFNIEGGQGV